VSSDHHGSARAGAAGERDAPTLRLIVAYKLARGSASLVVSAVLARLTALGDTAPLHVAAELLRRHATSAWSITLGDALVRAAASPHLWWMAAALALDGAFTFLEGWSLHRRYGWGPWLVMLATAAFLPFEAIAIARRADAGRILLLGVNLAVALYLARRARRARRRPPVVSAGARKTDSVRPG
jgi:uncharacterized membrane protein (DUF2068 family)